MKAIIAGQRVTFDSQNNDKLALAMEMHKEGYTYLGSSNLILINGVQFKCKKERHFFKRK